MPFNGYGQIYSSRRGAERREERDRGGEREKKMEREREQM
jgi:hypothetical protein